MGLKKESPAMLKVSVLLVVSTLSLLVTAGR